MSPRQPDRKADVRRAAAERAAEADRLKWEVGLSDGQVASRLGISRQVLYQVDVARRFREVKAIAVLFGSKPE